MQTIIQTPTPKLAESLSFYKQLNFKALSPSNPNLISDGKAIIEINEDRYARAGIKFFRASWEENLTKLADVATLIKTKEGYLVSAPCGAWIYLMETKNTDFSIPEIAPSVLGSFAGISFETIDIQKSLVFWQILGFNPSMGSVDQGWISLSNEAGMTISVMKAFACPHLFFNPSLSYFNGKENLAVIAKIRSLNIPITEEITFFNTEGIVDNIIIRDPGGLGFFIFSD